MERLLDQQSQEPNIEKRKAVVWEIARKLAEDVPNRIIAHDASYTCWHPHMKGFVLHENSIYSNWRFEQVWLDK